MTTPAQRDVVFYDGECGLCHALVRFALARDTGANLAFAPLHGETFTARIPADQAARLPESLVALTPEGSLLVRSDGTVRVLARLPAPWPAVSKALAIVPRPLRDLGYDAIAGVRALFPRPEGACPVVPAHLRDRLLP